MAAPLLVLLVIFTAGCAEYLPISGGALEGTVTAAPQSWIEVASADIIQLETNPQAWHFTLTPKFRGGVDDLCDLRSVV